jgi:protein-disulfide isomerase
MASSQSKFYGILGVILIAGAGLIAFVVIKNRNPDAIATTEYSSLTTSSSEMVSGEVGVARGQEDAPVLIEEYADYLCGACGMVATLTIPQVLRDYVDTGAARFIFYDYPLNPGSPAELAAQAARCAGDQNAFWAMHKVLMGRQREWGTARNVSRMFREYADALGLDGTAVEDCVESGVHDAVVQASGERARQLGLNQTPTFFINGQPVVGAMGYDRMAAMIEEELAKVQASQPGGEGDEDR